MENGRWKCALKGTLLIAIVIPAVMLLISVISGGLGVVLYAMLEKNMHLYVDCCLFLLYNERRCRCRERKEEIVDRIKSFKILGLSETATKEQVRAAYERKADHYKGASYEEEPEYAERKLKELYQAYQEALKLAGSSPDIRHLSPVKYNEDGRQEKQLAEKVHSFEKEIELKNEDLSKLKQKSGEMKVQIEDYNGSKPWETEDASADTGERLIETSALEPKQTGERKWTSKRIIYLVVTLMVLFSGLVDLAEGIFEDDSIDYQTDTYNREDWKEDIVDMLDAYSMDAYLYYEDLDLITEEDEKIAQLADETYHLLSETDCRHSIAGYQEDESHYQEQADLFAKNYFAKDSVEEVVDDLEARFPSFSVDEEESMSGNLDAIFTFYGFSEYYLAVRSDNPYTDMHIHGYGDYLDYLNQFYEQQ